MLTGDGLGMLSDIGNTCIVSSLVAGTGIIGYLQNKCNFHRC